MMGGTTPMTTKAMTRTRRCSRYQTRVRISRACLSMACLDSHYKEAYRSWVRKTAWPIFFLHEYNGRNNTECYFMTQSFARNAIV